MEKWKEVFVGLIPAGNYQTKIINGEDTGLVIELKNNFKKIIIEFGITQAIRIFDEGIVQKGLYSNKEIDKYKKMDLKI